MIGQTRESAPLLKVEGLKKSFDTKPPLLTRIRDPKQAIKVYAVDNVNFELNQGEVLGIIGESGCGKSTTARLILKLIEPDAGKIYFHGSDITNASGQALSEYRKKVQAVFQDPYEYLNPRMNVLDTVAEPLVINKLVHTKEEKIQTVSKYLELVGISPAHSYLYRYPHEMSGGQRQRIAIARSLIMQPELVLADEPTSMLDVSVRAGILNLLRRMKKELDLSVIFITHDITTAGYICDKIAVMYKGRIVEFGSRDDIIFHCRHPYTKALVNVAIDLKHYLESTDPVIQEGEVNGYEQIRTCAFEGRCLHFDDTCQRCVQQIREVEPGHFVACCKA